MGKGEANGKASHSHLKGKSLGRYLSERRDGSSGGGNMGGNSGNLFDVDKCQYERPKRKRKSVIRCESGIEWDVGVFEPEEGDLELTVQFEGLSFLGDKFTKGKKDYGKDSCVYFVPVHYKKGVRGKDAYLFLSTMGDIFQCDVVPEKKMVNSLFSDERHIPSLTEGYDPLSMKICLKNDIVSVGYSEK